tara:strand:- start:82 stop:657 length:576 start_codon:yes stop_codon:yes gene_type:complete
MKELTILLICILAIFIYISYLRKNIYLTKIISNIDKKEYYVRNLSDKQEASNKLAELSQLLNKLIDSLDEKDELKSEEIKRLKKSFNSENITENIPGSIYVAYSVNKGDELSICIREKESENFIDMNTIIFVSIHELAHIMSVSTGHTKEFWDNMKYLLKEASKVGIYQIVDYSSDPIEYCGMIINSTPLN